MRKEALELRRDPVLAAMSLFGTALLMFVMGYGISLDVENLSFAVLDHDQTTLSQNYVLNLNGSRYFVQQAPILDEADLDRRMRSGELALAIEIPPGFARDAQRGAPVHRRVGGRFHAAACRDRAGVCVGNASGLVGTNGRKRELRA